MELATALIWTLRIVLPLILFCIYFKLQSPNDDKPIGYPGPTKHAYSRGKLLARRVGVDPSVKPEALDTLGLRNQEQAPELFADRGTLPRRGSYREERTPKADRRERSERGGERGDRRGDRRERRSDKKEEAEEEQDAAGKSPTAVTQDKLHFESLLNYVAFNKRSQLRTFLPEEGSRPPPPPKIRRPDQNPSLRVEITGEVADEANGEAQMVLRGALHFRSSSVAKDLYDQLSDSNVEIAERTFVLMIEVCVAAMDLKAASDFLMKMETSGFTPESELLDKVMDLYSQQKVRREQEKQAQAAAANEAAVFSLPLEPFASEADGKEATVGQVEVGVSPADEKDGAKPRPKLKLSSDAPIFVPSFSPTSPTNPATGGSPLAAADSGNENPDASPTTALRTKLAASAKPFEPRFTNFDATMFGLGEDKDAKNGDSKGKGRANGKGKKDSNSKDSAGSPKWRPKTSDSLPDG